MLCYALHRGHAYIHDLELGVRAPKSRGECLSIAAALGSACRKPSCCCALPDFPPCLTTNESRWANFGPKPSPELPRLRNG